MYQNIKISKLEKSQVKIEGTVPADVFASFRKKAVEGISKEISLDGFRKGKVPENVLVSKIGEMPILEEMAELALSQVYPEIIVKEKIDAIGRPEIQITKIAAGNPLEFTITTSVLPEITLADYKKIAKEKLAEKSETIEVTDKDVEEAILRIQKSRVDHSGHDHENLSKEEHDKVVEASLPEVTDEFAQSLGDFKDVADLNIKIKEALAEDKKNQAKEKKRIALSDALTDQSKIDVPEILIASELKRIEMQFSEDIERMGVKLDAYLAHAKKTIDEIRAEWKPHAEKKAKLQLILNKIAETEKIEVKKEEIESEVAHIVEHYKDADKEKAWTYAETVLMNEKVFEFLEKK
ncbi:MAG: trigger factor [Patescibacteria group bacterium]